MKKRDSKLPGDGSPLAPSELAITPNPWEDHDASIYTNEVINEGESIASITFAKTSKTTWINCGGLKVTWTLGERNEGVVGHLHESKKLCTLGDARRAAKVKKKAGKGKKLKIKG